MVLRSLSASASSDSPECCCRLISTRVLLQAHIHPSAAAGSVSMLKTVHSGGPAAHKLVVIFEPVSDEAVAHPSGKYGMPGVQGRRRTGRRPPSGTTHDADQPGSRGWG